MVNARAVLHLGLPKTGTSFLQGTMRANADALAAGGVVVPGVRGEALFRAVLYLTERSEGWGRPAERGRRNWESLVDEIRAAGGHTSVVSSETLCLAKDHQVKRIVDDLADVDVHAVITVRDPGRQVPAEWQEGVKHGRVLRIQDYLSTVFGEYDALPPPRQQAHRRFWNAQHPVRVLDRWAAALGPEKVHLVVAPPAGTAPDALWTRFAEVIDASDVEVRLPEREANSSLGHVQTELLRRLNRRFPRKGREREYGTLVKRLYAGTILREQAGDRVRIPPRFHDRITALAEEWVADLAERGYHVVGDPAELLPRFDPESEPARIAPGDVLDASVDATAELLAEIGRLRAENQRLRGRR